MKRIGRFRKITTCSLRTLLRRHKFSYTDAAKELGMSRQALHFMCWHRELSDEIRAGRKEQDAILAKRIKQVFEDCYYNIEKTTKTLGLTELKTRELLRSIGIRPIRASAAECQPTQVTLMQKEYKLIKQLREELQDEIGVFVSLPEVFRAATELGKECKAIIKTRILENRGVLWNMEK